MCNDHVQAVHDAAEMPGLKVTVTKKWLPTICLPDGKGIGGKGRLRDKLTDKLQVYYSKTIGQNTHEIDCMQNAVLAIQSQQI